MKPLRFILVAGVMSFPAFAADISLNDGRVLKDATITSQTPRKVTIKHATGLSSVAKELLPPELQAQYPYNEAAARASDEKALIDRKAALNARKAESERLARLRTERDATAAAYEADQAKEAAVKAPIIASVKMKAQPLVEQYFEREYSGLPIGSRTAKASIDDVRPIDGVDGRWLVTGRVEVSIRHPSSALPYNSSFQLGGDTAEQWRDQYNAYQFDQQKRQADQAYHRAARENRDCPSPSANRDSRAKDSSRTKHPGDSHHSYKDRNADTLPLFVNFTGLQESHNDISVETRNFEATYTTENGTPPINVTVR